MPLKWFEGRPGRFNWLNNSHGYPFLNGFFVFHLALTLHWFGRYQGAVFLSDSTLGLALTFLYHRQYLLSCTSCMNIDSVRGLARKKY